jgi:hypothetical protein
VSVRSLGSSKESTELDKVELSVNTLHVEEYSMCISENAYEANEIVDMEFVGGPKPSQFR